MKKYLAGLILVLTIFALLPANAFAGKWWLLGTVKGNRIKEAVITLKLVRLGDKVENHVAVTSTNKYGQYAFSAPGGGQPFSPSAYKLVVFVGYDQITEVSLKGIRPGGRVRPITINW